MRLTEKHYHADRGDDPESYQSLDVVQEAICEQNQVNDGRWFIQFRLMETRWRSRAEAADYLHWAAGEIERLPE